MSNRPVQYVEGKAYFFKEEYIINDRVLIPRFDTERVVEKAIELIEENGTFLDLCSGSGCIGISTLIHRPDLKCIALDISPDAYGISVENAKRYSVTDRYFPHCADIFDFVPEMEYDYVVSNPPYIRSGDIEKLDPSVKDYEPRIALDGGADGLDFYRTILERYDPKTGYIFEIGYDMRKDIMQLAGSYGLDAEITKDYGGNDRVALIKRRQ